MTASVNRRQMLNSSAAMLATATAGRAFAMVAADFEFRYIVGSLSLIHI